MRLCINFNISIFGRKISMKIQGLNAEKKPLQNSKQYVYIVHYLVYLIFLDSNLKVAFFIIILNDTQMKTWCDFFVYFRRNNTNRLSRKSESQELKDSGKYWNRKEEDSQFPSEHLNVLVGIAGWRRRSHETGKEGLESFPKPVEIYKRIR